MFSGSWVFQVRQSPENDKRKPKSSPLIFVWHLLQHICVSLSAAIQFWTIGTFKGGCEKVLCCLRPKGMNYGRLETVNGPFTGQGFHSAADIGIIWESWMDLINILIVRWRNIVNKIIYWAPFAFFRRSLTLLVRNGAFGAEWTSWRQGRLLVFYSTLLHVVTRWNKEV